MKNPSTICIAIGAILVHSGSAQVVVSGGFAQAANVDPQQVSATAPSPLDLFLQQAPPVLGGPSYQLSSPPAGLSAPPVPIVPVAAAPAPAVVLPLAPAMPPMVAQPVQPAAAPVPAPPMGFLKPKGLLSVRSMKVANPGSDSKIFFGANSEFAMGTDSAGNFVVQQASAIAPIVSLDSANTLHLGSQKVEAVALDAQSGLSVRGVKQWQLVYSEDFSAGGAGWSRSEVSQCAGVNMLGGFCKFSRGEVNKTFSGLPPHKQLRVVATYHFIDRWIGETGFMKLNVGMGDCATVVWSERHSQQEAKNGLSLCGDAGTPEGKFSAPIDVTVPHHKDSVTVSFGSTMEDADACDESWGISSVEIHVRN